MAAEPKTCYRHPGRETYVSCSNCLRPICTDCMVQTAVGIKCPECAGVPTGVKKVTTRAKQAAGEGTGALATKILIGVNVLVFLAVQGQGGPRTSEIYREGLLYGPLVADGEWWRLVTSGFLHVDFRHILFNMVMLWFFGSQLEALLGRGRFLTVYMLSLLTGSAVALVVDSAVPTVGASGAVFGVLGAGLLIERRGIMVFGGAALIIVGLNLVFSFRPGISWGGHVGGLIGGMLAVVVLGGLRGHVAYSKLTPIRIAGLAAIAVGSLVVSYFAVAQYM